MNKLNDLKRLAEVALMDYWPRSFSPKATFKAANNEDYYFTSMSGSPLPVADLITALHPQLVMQLLYVVRSAAEAEKKFMNIDDGFFTGLVPPEFGEVSKSLRALEKHIGERDD